MDSALQIIVVLLAVGAWGYGIYRREKARSDRLQAVAEQLGLQFHHRGDPTVLNTFGQLRLFSQGRGRKTRNMLSGRTRDVDFAIFGYRYTTGGGKHRQTHRQTVICIKSPQLALPEFEVRPENVFHKIGQAFGYRDLDIDSHPVFSSRYLLRGSDEAAIRRLFVPELIAFLESQDAVSIEAANDLLIYYRAGKRIDPEKTQPFMEDGFRVYGLLRQP